MGPKLSKLLTKHLRGNFQVCPSRQFASCASCRAAGELLWNNCVSKTEAHT